MHQGFLLDAGNSQGNHLSRILGLIKLGAVVLFGLAGVAPTPAEAQSLLPSTLPPITDAIQSVGQAGPTPAWIQFCKQMPDECSVDASEATTLRLSDDIWSAIVDVNERVNSKIIAVTDQDHWGVLDRWDYPSDGLGDCEDIQLLKRKLLVEAGIPRRVLRMTVVIDEQGEGHAVLMVHTDHGDFILDNKRDTVLAWRQTGYLYVKREGDDGAAWVWLGDQIVPIVTANR
jgi:predicted transglutaminase-like cysteine proteinase